jgi:hypothetical protein
MSTRERNADPGLTHDAEEKPFRMLSIYDSPEAGREAAHASQVILRELGEEIDVAKTCWNVRSLETASIRSLAADEAAQADVIVVALSEGEPNADFKEWIEEWQGTRQLRSGLLALIPSGESETGGELADFLYETAVTAHMDFLCRKKRRF